MNIYEWTKQESLDPIALKKLLADKIDAIDFNAAKKDVLHFLKDQTSVNL